VKKPASGPEIVRQLTPHEKNPRYISEKRSAQLGKSMSKFGDLSVIVFNRRSGRVVCGHQRIKHLAANAKINKAAAQDEHGTVALGTIVSGARASWAYREVDWDEATEKAAMIAANAAGGDFEENGLKGLVLELDQAGFEMDLLNLRSLDDILKEAAEAKEQGAEDEEPAPAGKPRAKRGDVWVLGEHRVMCGDSTSRADMQKLMGHDAAHLVFTDPPYGVSYQDKAGNFEVIEGDHKRDDELHALVTGALKQAAHFSRAEAAFYIWHASSTRREFEDALRDAGLVERQYLIWVKNSIVLGHSDYRWAHEPCFYASKDGKKPLWHGDRAQPTVWRATLKKRDGMATTLGQAILLTDGKGGQVALTPRLPKGKKTRTTRLGDGQTIRIETASNSADILEVGRDQDHYVHPTQKPVELGRIAIMNSTKPGEIVLDCFGGSGMTMIAAEICGRKARVMELDAKYVDAEVKRWEELTGRTAVKETR
jgi:DNA modification methylase